MTFVFGIANNAKNAKYAKHPKILHKIIRTDTAHTTINRVYFRIFHPKLNPFVSNLFYNQATEFIFIHLIALLGGLLVTRLDWRVNYTRKINHFFIFFSPYLIKSFFPFEETKYTQVWLAIVGISTLAIYLKPIRSNVRVVGLMFAAFDRPEDQPHTLKWLFTQYLVTYMVALPLWILFKQQGHTEAIPIIILINAVGDGLAEPVGVTWGKNKYKVKALFTRAEYTRSLQGSACVLVVSVLAMILYRDSFTLPQFIMGLMVVPLVATVAEAKSPHTWDSPFIFAATGIVLAIIYTI
jgi:dolichol kinase